MVTDILAKHTDLYVAGEAGLLEAAFGGPVKDGVIELPGVMSRKKQVAPKVLAAF
jgi:manganese-dependent inorganic pyrophosphatase